LLKYLYALLLCLFLTIHGVNIFALQTNGDLANNSSLEVSKNAGKDDLYSQISLGEKMFYSGKFKEAQEIFNKVLEIDLKNPQAQFFLGLIEYENGNFEKAKTRFQIAYECIDSAKYIEQEMPNPGQIQLEFPDKNKANLYYKDGWYLKQKGSNNNQTLLSLDSGSNYKVLFKPTNKTNLLSKITIGVIITLSFLLVR
jgi:tetratricopeptide (TPR) repeat protein